IAESCELVGLHHVGVLADQIAVVDPPGRGTGLSDPDLHARRKLSHEVGYRPAIGSSDERILRDRILHEQDRVGKKSNLAADGQRHQVFVPPETAGRREDQACSIRVVDTVAAYPQHVAPTLLCHTCPPFSSTLGKRRMTMPRSGLECPYLLSGA